MTAETRLQDGVTQTVNYAYDLAGNLTQIVYPSGRIVDYSLDALGRPLSVTYKADAAATAQTVASNITYLPFGPVSSLTLGNGVDVTYTYDLDYRLTRIQAQAPGGGAMLQDLTLAFDGSGNITGITDAVDAARTQSLSYDLLNRLTQAIGPWGTDDYTYDPVGNRLSRTLNADLTSYTYATDSNRLLEVVTASLTREMFYDANGSLTMDRRGSKKNDPATDYAYNAAGRMESVDHHTGGTAAYTYDAFGRKRSIVEAGSTTRLFYGPAGTLLEESDATGTPGRGYLRVAGRPLAAVTAAGDLQWVLADQVGQPQKLLDASATLLWDRVAHPFGDTYAQVTGKETDEPQRFPGQRFEQLTGLHYNYFRDYDPSLGRYIQSDPIGLRGGPNIYTYANNNPVRYIDPEGTLINFPTTALCYFFGLFCDPEPQTDGCKDTGWRPGQNDEDATPVPPRPMMNEADDSDDAGSDPPEKKKASTSEPGDEIRTPTTHPDDFTKLKGGQGWRNKKTGEIWQKSNTNHSQSEGGEWKVGLGKDVAPTPSKKVTVSDGGTVIKKDDN